MTALPIRNKPASRPIDTSKLPIPGSVTVKKGDTLSGIAKRTGVSVDALRRANPQVKGDAIRPGQQLKIPFKPGKGKFDCRPPQDKFEEKKKPKLVGLGAELGATPQPQDPFRMLKLVGTGGAGW